MSELPLELEVYKKKIKIKNLHDLGQPIQSLYKAGGKLGEAYCIYVFLLEDISNRNPIGTLIDSKRDIEARKLAFGTQRYKFDDKLLPFLNRAKKYYATKVNTQFEKEMYTYDKKLDELGELLDSMSPVITKNVSEKTGDITFTSNIDLLNKMLKDILDIILTKTTLEMMNASGDLNRGLHIATVAQTPATSGKLNIT